MMNVSGFRDFKFTFFAELLFIVITLTVVMAIYFTLLMRVKKYRSQKKLFTGSAFSVDEQFSIYLGLLNGVSLKDKNC